MYKLFLFELKKVFKKKSIYVLFGLMGIFCFLNNLLYYLDYDDDGFYLKDKKVNLEKEKKKLEIELKKYDVKKESDVSSYLMTKSKLDVLNIKKNFSEDSWQYLLVDCYLYDIYYQINQCDYVTFCDNRNQYDDELKEKINKFYQDDWEYFLNLSIDKNHSMIQSLEESKEKIIDKIEIKGIQDKIDELVEENRVYQYRIQNHIKMGNNYLNYSLDTYLDSRKKIDSYGKKKLSLNEKLEYEDVYSKMKENEYILSRKENINKVNTAAYQLRTITEDYDIFLVLLILIVSSTIVCEEFSKGTIKLLLIKPYSRGKILLSKYCVSFFVLSLGIIFLIVMQLVIGISFFSMDSLKLPVIAYHFKSGEVIEYSIYSYMLYRIVVRLPFYLMLETVCFVIGVISTNVVFSMMIPMLMYMLESFMKDIMLHHMLFLKYSIFMNMHFENYLFGRVSFTGISLGLSIFIYLCYFVILILILFECFKRKEVKNI